MRAQVASGEIFEWGDADRRMLALKIPINSDQKSFKLHVRTNQEALLLNKGMVAARFLPGIYTLSASTKTSYLVESGNGDIAFVKSNFLVLKNWETSYAIESDLDSGKTHVSGTYDACIFDPAMFLKSVMLEKHFSIDDLSQTIQNIIADILPVTIDDADVDTLVAESDFCTYLEECLNLTLYQSGIIIRNFYIDFSHLNSKPETRN